MANALITPSIIANEALMILENNLVFSKNVHRGYDKEFRKVGSTISIRKPVNLAVRSGKTAQVQDVEEASVSVAMDQQKGFEFQFSTADLTLTIEEFSKRYLEQPMITLANTIDTDGLAQFKKIYNFAGTPGTVMDSMAEFNVGPKLMDKMGIPSAGRIALLGPDAYYGMLNGQSAMYVNSIAQKATQQGELGMLTGMKAFMTQNAPVHTVGDHAGTPLVRGASQSVTYAASKTAWTQTLQTDGWTGSKVLREGDLFTITGVYSVNPVSKASTGALQTFVVRAAATTAASSSNATELTISPPIITSGPYQTVTAAPADDAPITYTGTANTNYTQNLFYHPNAFTLVASPLIKPDGTVCEQKTSEQGLSVRLIKQYDLVNDEQVYRLDTLYGWQTIDPRLAARVTD